MEFPRLMLDSNVWRYLVDADGLEQVRRAAKSRVQILACPAVAFEALRGSDTAVRRKLAKAMTEGAWTRLMPEACTEAEELHHAITRHRPEWLRPSPDLREWYRLQSDWKHGWWQRARHDIAGEAARISSLDGGRMQAARAEAEFLRQDAMTNGIRFEKISLDLQAKFLAPMDGWDGLPFDAWRAEGMSVWWDELFTRRSSSAYFEWIEPWLKIDLIASQKAEWVSFWTRDTAVTELPRQWIRWALNWVQRTRKTTPGTAVDNQIGVYMPDCDFFVTSDKAFIDCIDKIRDASPVTLASCRRVPGGPAAVSALLNVIDECAAR